MKLPSLTVIAMLMASATLPALAQQGDGTQTSVTANTFKPAKVPLSAERMAALQAPAGFSVSTFATGLKNARMLAVAPNGTVYLSRRDQGDILMLRDTDGDGRADGMPVQVANRPGAHGLAIKDNKLYVATVKEIYVADMQADGSLGPMTMLIGDLPDSGQHPNRTISFGPDGMLYISVGSTCNACNESNPENATMLRASPDGKQRSIFASGLRNTIGFGWHPATGELWGLDHGIDYLGDDVQPEELNKIELGKQYGWPHVWGVDGINPQSTPVGDITKAQWLANSTPMIMGYTAHAAPMQMVFYPQGGSFPANYRGDAFATMRGSWNRMPASGYEIVRIRFNNGQPVGIEPFVTGFLTDGGTTHIARPVGLAVTPDGSLLMADDANGTIFRISYDGGRAAVNAASPAPTPSGPTLAQVNQGNQVPLANTRPETAARSAAPLTVQSYSFEQGAGIPVRHSEYADGVSPALRWSAVPGAVSYAIVMEDPDSRPITPFVHWVAWNIPGNVTMLPEGLQEQGRLTEPDGVMQGKTTRGSLGYYGPRPPVGDAPHAYHFQVLALDTMLALPAGANRDEVLAAARGHVIGKGELVGRYQQTVAPLK
ncbi:YbhB/YbcL family Raf kinase inhibitor-like protein [Pigmentiphaga aceris]|uniref:YbhB/YbcL family Raf kinase inhibitor-like protein n=1 Tax=Pigmentiphaga aceris TaxID=1940612 RepID=A0A5C0B636_9BURK|nr:YbhB/YbcL family Raf kinase inhibitor-like protein [Pigmentiphaga aceris]QEI08830.1 YbhB/YbcL family Raf kinase inhibitor-like protein [Pigmentiphaga aceris]